ncbi:MAG TPA: hypothetical protein VN836_09460 [Verrucomicrobiae bacterium]|nr:hypothetical protein [Verrucomicrobiae bacterium]
MHTKLFVTITAAIVVGVVVAYAIIACLRHYEQKLLSRMIQPKGEIGFAAIAKQRADMAVA